MAGHKLGRAELLLREAEELERLALAWAELVKLVLQEQPDTSTRRELADRLVEVLGQLELPVNTRTGDSQ